MRAISDGTFDDEVLRAGKPVVVDFWAPWCAPCRAIEPTLEELAARTPAIEFVKLDIDANQRTADRFEVLSLPTVILFAEGRVQGTVYGARRKKHFAKLLDGFA